MKSPVINLDNKKAGEIDLDDKVFGLPVRLDILNSAVNWHLSKRHTGSHKTKERAEVSGSTAKPFNQKGTGRARQGDKKAPHLRGGGVAFGPRVKDNTISLPKKVRKLALKTALSEKLSDGKLIILDKAVSKDGKSSWLEVECLGACVNSPMIQINEDYFEDLDPDKLEKIIDKINKNEKPMPGSYRGRLSSEPENIRKTLLDNKNA